MWQVSCSCTSLPAVTVSVYVCVYTHMCTWYTHVSKVSYHSFLMPTAKWLWVPILMQNTCYVMLDKSSCFFVPPSSSLLIGFYQNAERIPFSKKSVENVYYQAVVWISTLSTAAHMQALILFSIHIFFSVLRWPWST